MLSAYVVILRTSALNTVCNDGYMRRQRLAVMCDSRTCVVTAGRNKKKEQTALLAKMDAYCQEQTSMALADFPGSVSGGGTVAPPGPRPGPAVSAPLAPCGPCVPVSGGGRAGDPSSRKTALLGPVSPRFGAFDFSTRIKERRGEPRHSSHKAPQCGAFFGFRHRRPVAEKPAGERR